MVPTGTPRCCKRALWALLVLVCAGTGVRADEPLYYFVEGKGVVITNTPSRGDVKPVMKPRIAPVGEGAVLPATDYDDFIDRVAADAGLSPQLIKAVALVESGLNARAVSKKGAQGLMQLMPATARAYGVTDAFDPRQNLKAGATHLRDLMDEFDGNLTLALAAYNAGSAAVRRHGGVPDYRETEDYVRKVHAKLERTTPAPTPRQAPAEPVLLVRQADGSLTLQN